MAAVLHRQRLAMRRPYDAVITPRGYRVILGTTLGAFLLMLGYVAGRIFGVLISEGFTWLDLMMALALLGAEFFMAVHATGYFFNILKSQRRQAEAEPTFFSPMQWPAVDVLVASFNESEDVLDETLASARAMDYPRLKFYLLDDSTKQECQEGAARVAERYGFHYVHRTNRAGYKAGAINDVIPRLRSPYFALLDADQKPLGSWLKEILPYLEENPRLALVQSPQIYRNYEGLPVCEGATYQQAVWFGYICEGKAYSNAVFCCGSNCVLRREALLDIQSVHNGRTVYFDESSVTEDFATTYRLHLRGWGSDYVNNTYASGMGPETLPAYFVQQMRWAMGTMVQTKKLVRDIVRTPRAMSPAQWWEYFISCTYYFVGWANFIFMLAPICFVVFDIRPLRTDAKTYLYFFIPYIIFTMNLFFIGMKMRGHPLKGLWYASVLSFSTFWIYMRAAVVAILGLKRAFGVTPKGVGGAIPLRHLWMELTMCVANAATAIAGLFFYFSGGGWVYLINSIWAGYHAVVLSLLFFHFNKPVTITTRESCFNPEKAAA
jgi:cellulose synthase (UDP-forming)